MGCEKGASRRILPATFAWALLLLATGMFFAYPCWYLMKTYGIYIPIIQGVIAFFVIANFTLATFMDPGVVPKAISDEIEGKETEPLYMDVEVKAVKVRLKWCVTCQFFRPPRCTHCGICDSCIERFDHHCPWVNNCIGRRNYRFFFMFLLWLSIHMMSIFALCILYLWGHLYLYKLETIVSLAIVAIIVVLFLPILGLTSYHILLIFRGRTTNEQVTGKFKEVQNPYSQGCFKNMMLALCTSPYPSFKKWDSKCSAKPCHMYLEIEKSASREASIRRHSVFSQDQDKSSSIDSVLPQESHSLDCEPSPPPFRYHKNSLYLNLSNPTNRRQASPYHYGSKSLRAITPPVTSHSGHRFDHLKRSLPPHYRLHSSRSSMVDQGVSTPSFYVQNDVSRKCASSRDCSMNAPYHQSSIYHLPSPFMGPYSLLEHSEPKRNISSSGLMMPDIALSHTPQFDEAKTFLNVSETCCLRNQTVDKLQELVNKSVVAGQFTEVYMQEKLHRQCGNFNPLNYSKGSHDSSLYLSGNALSPMNVIGNACVDCQKANNSPCSSLGSMDHSSTTEFSRLPGQRPLSFVKAMEMSDTLVPICSEMHGQSNPLMPLYNPSNSDVADSGNEVRINSNGCEVSYEIRV